MIPNPEGVKPYIPGTNLVGARFGRLVVTSRAPSSSSAKCSRWVCRCDCGGETIAQRGSLLRSHTQSCGCLRVIVATKHGQGAKRTPIYRVWKYMRARCFSRKNKEYVRYGGRGITVCARWSSFENFYADMGDVPGGMQLDRIDNNGNYEPGNCKWSTIIEQANNRRNNRIIEFGGHVLTVAQWTRKLGLKPTTLYVRLYKGWSIERALTT